MSHLIQNQITSIEGIRKFSIAGYEFDPSESTDLQPVFSELRRNELLLNRLFIDLRVMIQIARTFKTVFFF